MIYQLLLSFIIGGFVIALTTYLVEQMNPTIGAIFYAYPIVYVISLLFMSEKNVGPFSKESIPAAIAIASFLLIFPIVYHYIKVNVYLSLFISTIIWIPLTLGIFNLHWKF